MKLFSRYYYEFFSFKKFKNQVVNFLKSFFTRLIGSYLKSILN